MRKKLLVATMVLGTVISLMGAAGIFAVFTDRATTGTNTVTSGERARAAELRIATGSLLGGVMVCSPFTDDLVTGVFTVSNFQPGSAQPIAGAFPTVICLKNAGSGTLSLSGTVIDLVDVDIDCTGDEAAAGDSTCGPLPGGAVNQGELAHLLQVSFTPLGCEGTTGDPSGPTTTMPLDPGYPVSAGLTPWPYAGGSLAPGGTACVSIQVAYPGGTSEAQAQAAQTDQVTWRFAFDGTA